MKIEVLNWKKYNPRKDLKSTSWLRLENDFCHDPDFYKFTCEQRMAWVYILCSASKKYINIINIDPQQIADALKIKDVETVYSAIDMLKSEELECIKVLASRPRYFDERGKSTSRALRTNERTNERTNVTNERVPVAKNKRAAAPATSLGSLVWLSYAKAYESLYRTKPVRNAKTNSLCKKLVEYVGIEKAIEIVRHYLTLTDPFYLKKAHDLGLCISDYQKILTSLESGINITDTKARQIDQRKSNHDAVEEGFKIYDKMKGRHDTKHKKDN